MKSIGLGESKNLLFSALSITSRTSFTPEVTALRVKNGRCKRLAIILESVNFRSDLLQQQTPQGVYEVICRYEEELGDMYV